MNENTSANHAHTDFLESLLVSGSGLARVDDNPNSSPASPAAWRVLAGLLNDGPLRFDGLLASGKLEGPVLRKVLADLIEREFVYRIADVDDSRAWLIAIAAKGERALSQYRVRLGHALAPLLSDLAADRTVLDVAADLLDIPSDSRENAA